MPPRKTADSDAEPPRRSARVAALPKEEESKPKTVRKASSSKKRPAETEEAVGAESSTAKKVSLLFPFERSLDKFYEINLG